MEQVKKGELLSHSCPFSPLLPANVKISKVGAFWSRSTREQAPSHQLKPTQTVGLFALSTTTAVCVMKYFLHQGCIVIKTYFCDAIGKANLSLYLCVQAYPEIANIPPKGKYNCNLIVKNTNIKVGRSCYISTFKVPNDSMLYSHLFQCKIAMKHF